jgi:aldose 1-epimerase
MQIFEENTKDGTVHTIKGEYLTVKVCPEGGMNIYEIKYLGKTVLDIDRKRKEEGKLYGAPILFPTPNRIRNNIFTFEGKSFYGQAHGFLKEAPFKLVKRNATLDKALLIGEYDWNKEREGFINFPFPFIIRIEITIFDSEIQYSYMISNSGNCVLPFGFGLHPFFQAEGGQAQIKVFADRVMEMTEDKLPTGNMLSVDGTPYDLREGKKASELNLDHVYLRKGSPTATITYKEFELSLDASEDFGHIVVFTPKADFFCIENQTCATDAHNLYGKGYQRESGLQLLKPAEVKSGNIRYCFGENRKI